MQTRARLIGAIAGALLAFAIGGAGWANAQTADDSTTTTSPPAATTPVPDAGPGRAHPGSGDGDCPNHDGGPGGGGGTQAPATTPTPAAPSAGSSDV